MICGVPFYNHNLHYADLVLAQVPPGCLRALDLGCGDGWLTRRLAARTGSEVVGLDIDPAMVELASSSGGAHFVCDDFLDFKDVEGFDFIVASASLHHMPLALALDHAAGLLRPGGVLTVLGLARPAGVVDRLWSAIASPVNLVFALSRRTSDTPARIREPETTLLEVRRVAAGSLPAVRVRRLLLWRYLLVWTKPS